MSPQNFCLNVGQLSPLDPPRDVAERVAPVNQFQKFAGLRLKPNRLDADCPCVVHTAKVSSASALDTPQGFHKSLQGFLGDASSSAVSKPSRLQIPKTGVSTFSKTQEVDAKNTVSPSAAASDSCTMVHTNSAVPARSWVRSTGIWSRKHSLAGPAKHSKHGKHSKYGLYRLSICKQDSLLASHQRGKWEIHNAICSINTLCLTIVATANRRCCW